MEGSIQTKDIEDILRLFRTVGEEVRAAAEEVSYCENQTQDCLHELELVDHNYHERARIAQNLVEIRKRRREAKDIEELLTPLARWVEAQNSALVNLTTVLGTMRKIDAKRKNRVYFYKADEKGKMIGG